MKNIILFLSLLIFNFSFSQSSVRETERMRIERVEKEEQTLFFELYNSVNELQLARKAHYDGKYDSEYLLRYSNRKDGKTWQSDLERIERYLYQNIDLYRENYSRIRSKYAWVVNYPFDLKKHWDIENLPTPWK